MNTDKLVKVTLYFVSGRCELIYLHDFMFEQLQEFVTGYKQPDKPAGYCNPCTYVTYYNNL